MRYGMKINFWIAAILLMTTTVVQAAEATGSSTEPRTGKVAGRVGYMSGTLVAQRADGTVKVLGPKSEVMAGDIAHHCQRQLCSGEDGRWRTNDAASQFQLAHRGIPIPVSYTHLRAHETRHDLVCR